MRRIILFTVLIISVLVIGFFAGTYYRGKNNLTTPKISTIIQRPLDKYTIDNLRASDIPVGKITIDNVISENEGSISYKFTFDFSPMLSEKQQTKTSGQIDVPNSLSTGENKYPLILMIRGYVDQESYKTGDGTRNAAKYFADNGFITVAPDFLGYGESDTEAGNIFEARFQTYTTVLELVKTIEENITLPWDHKNIFIWAHSNGGQIALTTLEVNGRVYPTVLWAPVSKPFPYSVLYYTDESEDKGKLIRSELAKFEALYNVELYSFENYLSYINAPLQIEQGTADEAVPLAWSKDLVAKLKDLEKDVTFYTYTGADHNLQPAWNTVVERDLKFYQSNLNKNVE